MRKEKDTSKRDITGTGEPAQKNLGELNGTSSDSQTLVALQGLTKRFPGVTAVDQVNLQITKGELHGIIGRNGAGKSVLAGLIAGVFQSDAGEIQIGEDSVDGNGYSPSKAHELGVSLVPQEPAFAPQLSVTENLFMGRSPDSVLGLVKPKRMEQRAKEIIGTLSLEASPRDPMSELPIETQQLIAFGKAYFIDDARVLLLDEITASLPRDRKTNLLELLLSLLEENPDRAFVLISHHISEIEEFCDRVSVMRDGRRVATLDVEKTTESELAEYIVGDVDVTSGNLGKESADEESVESTDVEPPLLSVSELGDGDSFNELDFELRDGEVLGFAGLDGSGKEAALAALYGLNSAREGTMEVEGEAVSPKSPREAISSGIVYLPRHRESEAVLQMQTVDLNTLISGHQRFISLLGFFDSRKGKKQTRRVCDNLRVKMTGINTAIDSLSGGNKQKVLFGRLLTAQPKIFLLNEPTRGVDISAKPILLREIRQRMAQNGAVVMASESIDEMVSVCDRIIVFFRGKAASKIKKNDDDFGVQEIYRRVQGVS
jgi:ABC-type sugar transport system ATPase subunit